MRLILLFTLLGCAFAVRQAAEGASNLSNADLQQLGTSFAKVLIRARAAEGAQPSRDRPSEYNSEAHADRKLLSSETLPLPVNESPESFKSWYTGSYTRKGGVVSSQGTTRDSSKVKARVMDTVKPISKGFSYLEDVLDTSDKDTEQHPSQGYRQKRGPSYGGKPDYEETRKRDQYQDEHNEEQERKYRYYCSAASAELE